MLTETPERSNTSVIVKREKNYRLIRSYQTKTNFHVDFRHGLWTGNDSIKLQKS